MYALILIAIGGAVGSVFRYGISTGIYSLLGREFPYGTLVVNVTGSFIMGLLYILFLERFNSHADQLRSLILIGLLGGYTTFSSFSIETFNLFETGDYLYALVNVLLSVCLCLGAVWLGAILGKQL